MSKSLKKSFFSGFFWSTGGSITVTLISLFSNIILAKYLSPKEFGLIGIVVFFTNLANILLTGGMASVLVREKEVSPLDYKTVFTFNFVISILCYLLIYFSASFFADFYNIPQLELLLKVCGIILFINAFQIVNNVSVIRAMKFKQRMLYNFTAVIISSFIAILAAMYQFGVWSLVILNLSNQLIILLQMMIFEKLQIGLGFSMDSFKKFFKVGMFTTMSNLLNTAFSNIYQLVLGKYFSINQVGYYYQAQKLDKVPSNILNYFAQNVMYSGLSKLQDDKEKIAIAYNKTLTYLTLLVAFSTLVIFTYSYEIIQLLFGARWSESSWYLQILVIASFFSSQELFNRVIFKIYNKTAKIFNLEILKKCIQSIFIIVALVYKDLLYLLLGLVLTSMLSLIVNIHFTNKLLSNLSDYTTLIKVTIICSGTYVVIKSLIVLFNLQGIEVFYTLPMLVFVFAISVEWFFKLNLVNKLIRLKSKFK